MSDWPGKDLHLTALWAEGLPTAEIGRRLGVTTNAVIGRAHRIKLPPRPPAIGLEAVERRRLERWERLRPIIAAALLAGQSMERIGRQNQINRETVGKIVRHFDLRRAKPPASTYVRPVVVKPAFRAQSVADFIAAGGQIKRCPAAAVHATTADMGDGREVIRAHAVAMAGDDGNWIQRAKKKMGRFHFGVGP